MLKKLAVTIVAVSTLLWADKLELPIPIVSPSVDTALGAMIYRYATTPSRINTLAGEYLHSRAQLGIDVPETLRVLALRVEFQEDDDSTTWGNGKMNLSGFGNPSDGLAYDPPHDRTYFANQMQGLRNFYLMNSRGRLQIEYDVYPKEPFRAYQLPHKMTFYGDTSNLDRGITLFMRDALLEAAKDSEIDFSKYKKSYSGKTFDMIVIFHAGSTIQSSKPYGYFADLASATVTPGALQAYSGKSYVDLGGIHISTASIVPESPRVEGVMFGLPGILYHEFAHLLGAYDLYDVKGYTQGVGSWSLMGGGGWLGKPSGQIPSMHDAFHRYHFGWEDPIVVTSDTTVGIFAAVMDTLDIPAWEQGKRPTTVLVPIRYDAAGNPQEYFLIENRQDNLRGSKDTAVVDVEGGVPIWMNDGEFDTYQPGSGIIIWHVDEDLIDKYGKTNFVNAWRAFGLHNAVDMEEADGIQDYELLLRSTGTYAIQGSKFDPFFKEDGGNPSFNPNSNPSSDGYYGKSGISIEVLDPSDTLMRIKISFEDKLAAFPQQAQSIKKFSAMLTHDIDGDGSKELLAFGLSSGTATSVEVWKKTAERYGTNTTYLFFLDSLASPPAIGDINGDGKSEIVILGFKGRLAVYDSLMNNHPSEISGSPYKLSGRSFAAPMLVDMDNDDDLEIMAVDEFGSIYAFNYANDSLSLISGYPVKLGEEIRPGFALVSDSPLRYVLLASSGELYLLDAAGTVQKGFPVSLGAGSGQDDIPPIVVDIDGDGEREILCFAYEYKQYKYYVVSMDGHIKYTSTRAFKTPLTSPAVADLNGDNLPEVIFGAANGLWAIEGNGTAVSGFPKVFPKTYKTKVPFQYGGLTYLLTINSPFYFPSPPLIGDFDGDAVPEIAMASPDHGVYLLDPLENKPYETMYARHPIGRGFLLSDLNADGKSEIIAGVDSGMVQVWKTKASKTLWSGLMNNYHNTRLIDTKFSAPPSSSEVLSELYVYPNPLTDKGYLHVKLGDIDKLNIHIFDISGKLISELHPSHIATNAENDIILDSLLPNLTPGLYIIRVEALKGDSKTVKLYKFGVIR